MKTATKIWLICAAIFVLIGCIIFGGVMTILEWDFTKLSTVKLVTNEHEINEPFNAISVKADTADLLLVPSEGSEASVVCCEQSNMKHLVAVEDGALKIEVEDTRKWYEYIGINFGSPKITVYIPGGEYGTLSVKSDTGDVEIPKEFKFESIDISESTGDVKNYASASGKIKIKTSTGDILIEDVSAAILDLSVTTGTVTASDIACEGDIKISVSTGKTEVTDTECKKLISDGSTGDIVLKGVIATGKLSIERSTGDIRFDGSDAGEIFIKTDTGDVRGGLLSDKVFFVQADTGSIDVPKTARGGRCEITTDTGDIKIQITK